MEEYFYKKRLIKTLSAFLTCVAVMSIPVVSLASTKDKATKTVVSIHQDQNIKNKPKTAANQNTYKEVANVNKKAVSSYGVI